jgi:hypothetical protein
MAVLGDAPSSVFMSKPLAVPGQDVGSGERLIERPDMPKVGCPLIPMSTPGDRQTQVVSPFAATLAFGIAAVPAILPVGCVAAAASAEHVRPLAAPEVVAAAATEKHV